MLCGLFGKLGAFLTMIPSPVIGASMIVGLGMVSSDNHIIYQYCRGLMRLWQVCGQLYIRFSYGIYSIYYGTYVISNVFVEINVWSKLVKYAMIRYCKYM